MRDAEWTRLEAVDHAVPEAPELPGKRLQLCWKILFNELPKARTVVQFGMPKAGEGLYGCQAADERKKGSIVVQQTGNAAEVDSAEFAPNEGDLIVGDCVRGPLSSHGWRSVASPW